MNIFTAILQFFKDSLRELKHVVWPTRKETQKFFVLVIFILCIFGIYLFAFNNLFSTIVFGLKDMFGMNLSGNTSSSQSLSDEEIDSIISNEGNINFTQDASGSINIQKPQESQTNTSSSGTQQ